MDTANWTLLQRRDQDTIIHPFTPYGSSRPGPGTVITRGEGIYVFDDQGNRYIEGLSGLFNASLGYSEKRLVDAAIKQMNVLPTYHKFGNLTTEVVVELGEKLLSLAPVPMSKVLFACSGSEANDSAIKTVWYYNNAIGRPNKKKIISRKRSYHGMTLGATSLTGTVAHHAEFDAPLDRFLYTEDPNYYRNALPGETEEEFATRLANQLEQLIIEEGPETIAAFFAEPVSSTGGSVVPPISYFGKIQEVLERYDVLFVVDEVICGFGRTGSMFGSETFGLKPDIMVMAKQLSSGYMPISAMMVNEKIAEALDVQSQKLGSYTHGFTYGGHPVAAAVALEALRIYEERDVVGHVRKVSIPFQERAKALGEHPLVGYVRSIGLMAGIEFVSNKETKARFTTEPNIATFMGACVRARGVIGRGGGDVVQFCPPLIITETEVHDLFDRVSLALDDVLNSGNYIG